MKDISQTTRELMAEIEARASLYCVDNLPGANHALQHHIHIAMQIGALIALQHQLTTTGPAVVKLETIAQILGVNPTKGD